jgi:diketogulonate reductase-like aldo/keto reductase
MGLKTVKLPSGRLIPALGLGMWYLGKDAGAYFKELELLQQALQMGFRVFDTAELYGDGGAEELLGDAVAGCRDEVFLVSKVSPEHVTYEDVVESCEHTLKRLKTDYLDMYLLHWCNGMSSMEEILEAFLDLKDEGKILDFGVSNFDVFDLEEWLELDGADQTAMNQTLYNLSYRRAEEDILPFCRKMNIPLIAYAALDADNPVFERPILRRIASDRNVSPRQIMLAWTLSHENVGALCKCETQESLRELYGALKIKLTEDEFSALDIAFPPPEPKSRVKFDESL